MPKYGTKLYSAGGTQKCLPFAPGYPSLVFGNKAAQAANWAAAQGEPHGAVTGEILTSAADASQPVVFKRDALPAAVAVEIKFSGAPGAFGVDLQVADSDTDAAYTTLASVAAVNAGNIARLVSSGVVGRFARLKFTSFANVATVNVIATMS